MAKQRGKKKAKAAPSFQGLMGQFRVQKRIIQEQQAQTGPKITGDLELSDWIELEEWVDVESSNVAKIRYEGPTQTLLVTFRHGGIYAYTPVSKALAKQMYKAPSLGRFVWRKLRDKVPFTKVG